jgi:hypothetical protein
MVVCSSCSEMKTSHGWIGSYELCTSAEIHVIPVEFVVFSSQFEPKCYWGNVSTLIYSILLSGIVFTECSSIADKYSMNYYTLTTHTQSLRLELCSRDSQHHHKSVIEFVTNMKRICLNMVKEGEGQATCQSRKWLWPPKLLTAIVTRLENSWFVQC